MSGARQNDDVPAMLLNSAIAASRSVPERMRPDFLKALSEHHRAAADLIEAAANIQRTSGRPFGGMSLRDWFAGQALAGMLAMPSDPDSGNFHNNCGEPFIGTAKYAYRMADAMLKAREASS